MEVIGKNRNFASKLIIDIKPNQPNMTTANGMPILLSPATMMLRGSWSLSKNEALSQAEALSKDSRILG